MIHMRSLSESAVTQKQFQWRRRVIEKCQKDNVRNGINPIINTFTEVYINMCVGVCVCVYEMTFFRRMLLFVCFANVYFCFLVMFCRRCSFTSAWWLYCGGCLFLLCCIHLSSTAFHVERIKP